MQAEKRKICAVSFLTRNVGDVPDAPRGAVCADEAREKSLPIRGGGREAGRKGSAR